MLCVLDRHAEHQRRIALHQPLVVGDRVARDRQAIHFMLSRAAVEVPHLGPEVFSVGDPGRSVGHRLGQVSAGNQATDAGAEHH